MISRVQICALCLLLATLGNVAPAQDDTPLAAEADYRARLSQLAAYEVEFRIVVVPPQGTQKLKVWLPLPQDDQAQKITRRRLTTRPRTVKPRISSEPIYHNQFAYFEFDSPTGAQLITHQFEARIHQMHWQVDYLSVVQPEAWPDSFLPYQRIDPRAEQGEQWSDLVQEITLSSRSSTRQLLNAMQWVDANLTYDSTLASLTADPLHALVHRRGHCSDYHGLCSTLAQKVGYPSRVTYGLQMFDKGSPSHCKLEIFLPPYGWVPYDLSETQKLTFKIASDDDRDEQDKAKLIERIKQRTRQGFRENTWLKITHGTHYQLSPPASRPVALIREIYAEADGKPLPDLAGKRDPHFFTVTIHRVDNDGSAKPFQVLQ
ncbi:MAG: transglutaminase-like domain-containing protein [Pirellulales bacterium]|nr:transglutaminase-like domain-containing protein [Pirellulales bacterium]